MATLRVDPWDPERGASFEATDDSDTPPDITLDVESVSWSGIHQAPPHVRPTCAFIDGVRRIDLRLFAEDGGTLAPGLVGSWATGVVWTGQTAYIEPVEVGRRLIVGGGLVHGDLSAQVGNHLLHYPFTSVPGTRAQDPIQALQTSMREAEAQLARETAAKSEADLLVVDGPLTYLLADPSQNTPVIGLAKRQTRSYLPADRMMLLRDLSTGSRTPLFQINGPRPRYSWYARLADGRPFDGTLTGIVRLELFADLGLQEARLVANLVSAILPQFASVIGRDPRAPQNLYPVGHLEKVLQHRLGHPLLIRRSLEAAVWRAND